MSSKPTKPKTPRKTKVYECAYHEFECDDLGKYCWCRNPDIHSHQCDTGRGYYCQKFCPGFKRGRLRGEWEISDWERQEAREYKAKIKREAKERETSERALLKYLKEKYET